MIHNQPESPEKVEQSTALFSAADKSAMERENRRILEAELLSKKVEFESKPYEAHIQFSNFCNMSCVMCWNGKNPETQKLSEELIARIGDQIGPHISLVQPYDGSEPLIFTWEESRDLALKYGLSVPFD